MVVMISLYRISHCYWVLRISLLTLESFGNAGRIVANLYCYSFDSVSYKMASFLENAQWCVPKKEPMFKLSAQFIKFSGRTVLLFLSIENGRFVPYLNHVNIIGLQNNEIFFILQGSDRCIICAEYVNHALDLVGYYTGINDCVWLSEFPRNINGLPYGLTSFLLMMQSYNRLAAFKVSGRKQKVKCKIRLGLTR